MINESLDKIKFKTKSGNTDIFEQIYSCTH